jgi:hypothetical protein
MGRPDEPVEHVTLQSGPVGKAGVVELAGGHHPEPLHHGDRAAVGGHGKRHDLVETQGIEPDSEHLAGRLGGDPRPQTSRARRQPISTQGVNGAWNPGMASPTNPTKGSPSVTSTAHRPQPSRSRCAPIRPARASLSSRDRGPAKCSITRSSALTAANGSSSTGRQWRRRSRGVEMFKPLPARPGPPVAPPRSCQSPELPRQPETIQDRLVLVPRSRAPVGRKAVPPPGHREFGQLPDRDGGARGTGPQPAFDVFFRPEEVHRTSGECDLVPPVRGRDEAMEQQARVVGAPPGHVDRDRFPTIRAGAIDPPIHPQRSQDPESIPGAIADQRPSARTR